MNATYERASRRLAEYLPSDRDLVVVAHPDSPCLTEFVRDNTQVSTVYYTIRVPAGFVSILPLYCLTEGFK